MSASECLRRVSGQIQAAAARCARPLPRLVAVSKTKPVAAIEDVYAAGHRHFGENYVQELVEKAPLLPPDVRWHFIGQLQSNKAKNLVAGVPNLWAVESVDSVKLATLLQKAAASAGRKQPLRVFVQVNTSAEPQKGGAAPGDETVALCRHVIDACPGLRLVGLMTIGKLGETARVFFDRLAEERERVLAALAAAGVPPSAYGPLDGDASDGLPLLPDGATAPSAAVDAASGGGGAGSSTAAAAGAGAGGVAGALELSMGMSGDFELAISAGSTNIRVGSAIFGAREYAGSKAAAAASDAAAKAAEAAEEEAAAHAAGGGHGGAGAP